MKKHTRQFIRKHRKNITKVLLGVLLVGIFWGGYTLVHRIVEGREVSKINDRLTRTISFQGRPYKVVVSHTDEMRQQGLSNTLTMPHDGMLFVFPEEEFAGFWMEDMNYSIDIVWMDADSKIIDITKDISPKTYPKVFYPTAPVKYVLEFPGGFADSIGIQVGSRIDLGPEVAAQ